MADQFKTFDKAPIIGATVSFSRWSFGLREVILAIIAILLLVMCLIFAGLFGRAETKLSEGPPSAAAIVGQSYCVDQSCLQTSARTLKLMNTSVNPCENFYQYACGNYKDVTEPRFGRNTRSILSDIYNDNEDRLIKILEQPVDRYNEWSSERKLKHFFQSCNNMFTREKLRATPFLTQVVPVLGGWDLLGTWDNETWDLNTVLKKVQSDFWTDALYGPWVNVDWSSNHNRNIMGIQPAGIGKFLDRRWFTRSYFKRYLDGYKKFIRRVGWLFMRDAKLTTDKDTQEMKLEQFVNDTFAIETSIATLAHRAPYDYGLDTEAKKVKLSDLNTETNNVIDWVGQFQYMLTDASITGNTKVFVSQRQYFKNITSMITNLPDADRKRMLHNYLIWRVAEIYVQDLSWEYIHANREIYNLLFGHGDFAGIYRYCFDLVRRYMDDALGYLYVKTHFSETNKQHVHDITHNLKSALQDTLDKTPWMDDKTKTYAKTKLDHVTFKLGYPDWMANHDKVDQIYNDFKVDGNDFFANLLNGNNHHRSHWSRLIKDGVNREEWIHNVYATTMYMSPTWNEVAAPAGILQSPIYDYRQPLYSTFGSLGSLLGRALHHVVDDFGKHYDKDGVFMEEDITWWTNKSLTMYATTTDCALGVINGVNQTIVLDGETWVLPIDGRRHVQEGIAIIGGVNLALKGYRKWISERGVSERMLPGVELTDTQMLFLSFAQTSCSQPTEFASVMYAFLGRVSDDLKVNLALNQIQEFSDAFGCKKTDKMNSETKCTYY